ncbi:MAG: tetratricopeptide repeat protein, partial [Chloroflexota bacterium]
PSDSQMTPEPVQSDLPDPNGPFFGRSQEVVQLESMLASEGQRLITIVGNGGMGKSRLALHLGRKLEADESQLFPDGIVWIDFTARKEISQIVPAIARALKLTIKKERRLPLNQLTDWLRSKQMLLILDNFDRLIEESHVLSDLLESAPGLKMVVTSRQRLSLQEEQVFPLQGLIYPESSDEFVQDRYPAVDLFVELARKIQPEFVLTADNVTHVVELCQLVEGMPLSIELAATWTDMLSPEEIAAEIRNSLDFLEANVRNFLERHRSIRAVFDGSWDRLSRNEQKIFARLSEFRGGFSRRAARAVAGASLPVLARLVDRSMIRYNSQLAFYQMNELLRQYGAEKLEMQESAENIADLRERHSVYYLEALEERNQKIKGDGQRQAIDEIGRDFKNVRRAWRWAVRKLRPDLIEIGIEPLANFLEFQGRYREGEETFVYFSDRLTRKNQPELKRLLLHGWAWRSAFELSLGKTEQAENSLAQAISIVESLTADEEQTLREQAFVLMLSGHFAATKDLADAKAHYQQALELYRQLDMTWEQAFAMMIIASVAKTESSYEEASNWLYESLKIQQSTGDQIGTAETMANMSELSRFRGQFKEALNMAQHSVDLAHQIQNKNVLALGLLNLGMANFYLGDFNKQHQYVLESLALYESLGNTGRLPDAYYSLSLANAALGQFDEAGANAQRALDIARQIGNDSQAGRALFCQGLAALTQRSYDSGLQLLERGLVVYPEQGQVTDRMIAEAMMAYAELNIGNPTHAKRLLFQSLNAAVAAQDPLALLVVIGVIALILLDQGDEYRALCAWRVVWRLSPPLQKAAWIKKLYGERLGELFEALPADEREKIEAHLQKNSLWDEAGTLVEFVTAENWGRPPRR